jgi:hypothetical protein
MAAQGFGSTEILEAFWSESHGKTSAPTSSHTTPENTLSCGGELRASARRL